MRSQFHLLHAFFAVAACASVAVAGDLTPPGAPGPTMKSLDVVEARTPIFAADLPLTISQPGSYYLAENIVTAGGGITIAASEVSIDLNGFSLAGGSGTGIQDSGTRSNLRIVNGSVRDWSGGGVVLDAAQGVLIEGVATSGNQTQGIWIGSGVIRNCVSTNDVGAGSVGTYAIAVARGVIESSAVVDSNGSGFWMGVSGVVRGVTVNNCTGNGVLLGSGATLTDSTISSVGLDGVSASSGVTISDVSVYSVGQDGVDVFTGSTVTNSTFRFCSANGVNARGSSIITNNSASSCGSGLADGAGFRTTFGGNRLDSNNAANCNRGFYITQQGDFLIRNTARNCTIGYSQIGTNVYGTIISNNFSPITTTNPWVNFEIF
jgi:hypothetical protein